MKLVIVQKMYTKNHESPFIKRCLLLVLFQACLLSCAHGQFIFPRTIKSEDSLSLARAFQKVENAVKSDSFIYLLNDSSFCSDFRYKYVYSCSYHTIEKDLIWGLPHATVEIMKVQIRHTPRLIYRNEHKLTNFNSFRDWLIYQIDKRLIYDSLNLNFELLYSIDKGNLQKENYFHETQIYHAKNIDSRLISMIFIFSPDGKVYRNVISKYSTPTFNNIAEFRYIINNKQLKIEVIRVNGAEIIRYFTTYKVKKNKLVFLNFSTNLSSIVNPGYYEKLPLIKI